MAKTMFPDSMMDELPRDKEGRIELHAISGVGEMTGEVPAAFGSDHEPAEKTSADARPDMSGEHSRLPADQQDPVDFPAAPSLANTDEFMWDESKPPVEIYAGIGEALAEAGDLFRSPTYAGGLVLASRHPNVPSMPVNDPESLRAVILDRLRVNVVRSGKPRDGTIRAVHLKTMLKSEAFLQQFRAVDEVIDRPMYLEPDFRLTSPGYNDGGYGRRYLHVGTAAVVADGREAIDRFLDVMDFESDADRVNAIAAGLTVLLRNLWPGGKPIIVVTANKSHAGKETIISFAGGATPMVGLSYTEADWALERNFVAAVGKDRKIGLVNIDNARLGKHRNIRSAFLERYLTDPKPFLFSTGTGRPVRRMNTIVLSMSMNHGSLIEDLMNRSLPIRLALSGDVIDRRSPIGNPKLQYLPANRERIEAEFHGMIGRWVAEGMPLDLTVSHPFSPWARTVGGILRANGLIGFLGNLAARRSSDDPVRRALGLLGDSDHGEFRTSTQWAQQAARLGLVKILIPEADRDSESGRARGMGIVLSDHSDVTLEVETDDYRRRLRLRKQRRRYEPGDDPSTRYAFEVIDEERIPADLDL